jgi:catechol 2,3-dioxygenase-like lactoylglutathione lyase family enzyme
MTIDAPGTIYAVDHVQLAIPAGQEELARTFYIEVLGFSEYPKPANLAQRGGLWLVSGTVKLHLGIDREFRAAQKAHPGLLVSGIEVLVARCVAAGYPTVTDSSLEGYRRAYVSDPFGNRIELLEPVVDGNYSSSSPPAPNFGEDQIAEAP